MQRHAISSLPGIRWLRGDASLAPLETCYALFTRARAVLARLRAIETVRRDGVAKPGAAVVKRGGGETHAGGRTRNKFYAARYLLVCFALLFYRAAVDAHRAGGALALRRDGIIMTSNVSTCDRRYLKRCCAFYYGAADAS